jgi:hypothetical protein
MGHGDVAAFLTRSFYGLFIGVLDTTCAYCGPRSKTLRPATAATPSAAATPIPIPANIDLFTGLPPLLLIETILQSTRDLANEKADEKCEKSGKWHGIQRNLRCYRAVQQKARRRLEGGAPGDRLVQLQARANDAVDAPTSIIRPVLK